MRSYWIQPGKHAAGLELRECPIPEPAAGQLLVRMRAAALNRGEFLGWHGLHPQAAGARPAGVEGSGEVVETGAGVAHYRAGDAVMGRCQGAFSEYALMDAREAVPVPARLAWEQAAGASLVFMVVHEMLIAQGHLAAGEWLLITGVSSGVGVAALQVAKLLKANTIGTSRSATKLEKLRALGLDVGIATRRGDFFEAVIAATAGQGANLVVNNVGGSVFADCVRSLAFQGRLAVVGYVDGVVNSEIDLEAVHAKRLHLFGVSNKLWGAEQRAVTARNFMADILPAIADGRIRPVVDRVFDFADLPTAKAHMESDAHLGKIIVRMPS
jgi:NADPH:quinone reductase